jgi:uncharacterized protein with HEPN domain
LTGILAAAAAIADHITRGTLDDGLVFDAVRVRLIEIGEAVKAIDPDLLVREPAIPWMDVAGMRNHLAHWYFDTGHAIVQATLSEDLPPLVAQPSGSSITLLLIPGRDPQSIRGSVAGVGSPRAFVGRNEASD